MTKGARCTFCDKTATELHHIAGRYNCSWLVAPVCTPHHRLITRAHYHVNPAMMKRPSNLEERIRHAREGCLTFLWLLDHPEEIDPERILVVKPGNERSLPSSHGGASCEP